MGGRLGSVVKSYLATVPGTGATAQWLAVEEFAGDERKAQVFGPAGEDFAPPVTTETLDIQLGADRAFLVSAAYRNPNITPIAKPGERRMYSTDENGAAVKAEIHLKQDGEIYAGNDNASAVVAPSGAITITNPGATVTISAAGAVSVVAAEDIQLVSNSKAGVSLGKDGSTVLWGLTDIIMYAGPVTSLTYVQLLASGVCNLVGTTWNIDGDVNVAGNVATVGTLLNNTVNVSSTHTHGGVQTGTKFTTGPV